MSAPARPGLKAATDAAEGQADGEDQREIWDALAEALARRDAAEGEAEARRRLVESLSFTIADAATGLLEPDYIRSRLRQGLDGLAAGAGALAAALVELSGFDGAPIVDESRLRAFLDGLRRSGPPGAVVGALAPGRLLVLDLSAKADTARLVSAVFEAGAAARLGVRAAGLVPIQGETPRDLLARLETALPETARASIAASQAVQRA